MTTKLEIIGKFIELLALNEIEIKAIYEAMDEYAKQESSELLKVLQQFMAYYESDFFKFSAKDGRTKAEWVVKADKAIKKAEHHE